MKTWSWVLGLLMTQWVFAQDEFSFNRKVGDFTVNLLSERQQTGNTSLLIGATPEMILETMPNGTFSNAINAFWVQTPDQRILVDTGLGIRIYDELHALGISEEQVDVVLITHMHGDHIGGLLRDGKAVFPNAAVYLPQGEYDYWLSEKVDNPQARSVVDAYQNRLHLFTPNELESITTEILPGFYGVAAYGHTPGHTLYLLESKGEKLLIWADLTHAMAIQMPYPKVALTYDVDPQQAVASREKVLAYVTGQAIPVAGMHIAFPGMGTLESASTNNSYTFSPFLK